MDKDELIQWLHFIGDDFDPDDPSYVTSPECEGQGEPDEDGNGHCPDHGNCGICRYEYMKSKGWLSEGMIDH